MIVLKPTFAKVHTVRFYEQDAENIVQNRVTTIITFSTYCNKKVYWYRLSLHRKMFDDPKSVQTFICVSLDKYVKRKILDRSFNMVKRLKNIKWEKKSQLKVFYLIT